MVLRARNFGIAVVPRQCLHINLIKQCIFTIFEISIRCAIKFIS